MLIECFDCISKLQKGGNSRIKVDFYCTGAAVGNFLNTCFTKLFFFAQYNLQILFLVCVLKEAIQTTALDLDPFSGPRVSGRGWFASMQQNSLPSPEQGGTACWKQVLACTLPLAELRPGEHQLAGRKPCQSQY